MQPQYSANPSRLWFAQISNVSLGYIQSAIYNSGPHKGSFTKTVNCFNIVLYIF